MNAHLPTLGFDSGATFSPDGLYRYHLWRLWGDREHRCVFVGLNPSTADAARDDPTIRKCAGFAKRWGFGAVDVVNVFAWRSTKPVGILRAADPVGPDNDEAIAHVLEGASRVVWVGVNTARPFDVWSRGVSPSRLNDGLPSRRRATRASWVARSMALRGTR